LFPSSAAAQVSKLLSAGAADETAVNDNAMKTEDNISIVIIGIFIFMTA
jgi:hypothetical protein